MSAIFVEIVMAMTTIPPKIEYITAEILPVKV